MVEEEVRIKLVADATEYEKGTQKASRSAGKLGGRLEGMSKKVMGAVTRFGPALAGIGVAVGGAVKGVQKLYTVSRDTSKMYDPARFDKSTAKLQRSLRQLKTSLGAVLMPIYEAMNSVMSTLAGWLNGLAETFARVMGFVQGLVGAMDSMRASLNTSADAMAEAGAEAEEGLASFDKLTTLGTSELGDMTQAERMNEIMLESAKAGARLRDSFRQIFGFVSDIGTTWARVSSRIGNWWGNVTTDVGEFFSGIGTSLGNIWTTITTKVGDIGTGIWETLTGVWDSVVTSFKSAFQGAFDWFSSVATGVGDAIKNALTTAFEVVKTIYDETLGKVIEGIKVGIERLGEFLAKLDLVGKAKGMVDQFLNWGGNVINDAKKAVGLASGGVFEPNNPTLAVIGDNTHEKEIASPVSTMKEAFRDVLAEAGAGQGGPVDITINIDGRKVANATYDYIEQEYKRRGASW